MCTRTHFTVLSGPSAAGKWCHKSHHLHFFLCQYYVWGCVFFFFSFQFYSRFLWQRRWSSAVHGRPIRHLTRESLPFYLANLVESSVFGPVLILRKRQYVTEINRLYIVFTNTFVSPAFSMAAGLKEKLIMTNILVSIEITIISSK